MLDLPICNPPPLSSIIFWIRQWLPICLSHHHTKCPLYRYLRAVAYRTLVKWIFGYLGWDTTRPLTACIYNFIRNKYSTNNQKLAIKILQNESNSSLIASFLIASYT